MIRLLFISSFLVLFACSENANRNANQTTEDFGNFISEYEDVDLENDCKLEDSLIAAGLVNIQDLDSSIFVHLRYSTRNNFLHTNIYGCLKTAYLQLLAAEKLVKAQQFLQSKDSSLHLLVWDAVRPRSRQWRMWNAVDMPFEVRIKYVSNPANGSVHNYGCAVDLTICNAERIPLDMGTDFDHFGLEANIDSENDLVNQKLLTRDQVENRILLREVMRKAGFTPLNSEWWHFNAVSRSTAKELYTIIE